MLNFNRRDRAPEPAPGKFALNSQDATGVVNAAAAPAAASNVRVPNATAALRDPMAAPGPMTARPAVPPSTGPAGSPPASAPAPSAPAASAPAAAAAPAPAAVAAPAPQAAPSASTAKTGSKLSIGVNIKLKGVEISDCDSIYIEGTVEAMVRSAMMEIAEPGTLNGTALIDVAEIHGSFTGDLTARTRLVIHGTGRVSGKIRYGKLVVAEGGELSGDVQRIEDSTSGRERPAPATTVSL